MTTNTNTLSPDMLDFVLDRMHPNCDFDALEKALRDQRGLDSNTAATVRRLGYQVYRAETLKRTIERLVPNPSALEPVIAVYPELVRRVAADCTVGIREVRYVGPELRVEEAEASDAVVHAVVMGYKFNDDRNRVLHDAIYAGRLIYQAYVAWPASALPALKQYISSSAKAIATAWCAAYRNEHPKLAARPHFNCIEIGTELVAALLLHIVPDAKYSAPNIDVSKE